MPYAGICNESTPYHTSYLTGQACTEKCLEDDSCASVTWKYSGSLATECKLFDSMCSTEELIDPDECITFEKVGEYISLQG